MEGGQPHSLLPSFLECFPWKQLQRRGSWSRHFWGLVVGHDRFDGHGDQRHWEVWDENALEHGLVTKDSLFEGLAVLSIARNDRGSNNKSVSWLSAKENNAYVVVLLIHQITLPFIRLADPEDRQTAGVGLESTVYETNIRCRLYQHSPPILPVAVGIHFNEISNFVTAG